MAQNFAMRDMIAQRVNVSPACPCRVGATNGSGRSLIGVEAQDYQPGHAPSIRLTQTGCRSPVPTEPDHRGAREGRGIIAGSSDNSNRHHAGDPPPVFPAMKLRQIVCPHQPDKAPFRPAPQNTGQRINGKARAKFPLHRAYPDWGAAGLPCGRGKAIGQRGHILPVFQGVAG
ncbi:MAG: hypothetical protein RLZZ136_527 [Pseudomonadota bacterium]